MGGKLSITKRWRRRREQNYYITAEEVRNHRHQTCSAHSNTYRMNPYNESIRDKDTEDEHYETLPAIYIGQEQEVDTEEEAVYESIPEQGGFERGGCCRTSQTNSEDSGVEATNHCPFHARSSLDQCACDPSCLETNAKFVEYMVEVFQPLICSTIRADEISRHMNFIDKQRFRSHDNPSQAMKDLLQCIDSSQEPGKWREFLDALHLTENEYMYKLLTGKTEKDHSMERRVLELYTEELKKNISLNEIVDHLFEKKVINEIDKQNIEAQHRNYGEIEATDLLIDRIPKRFEDWNRIFIEVLRKCGNPEMADLIEEATIAEDNHSCSESTISHETKTKRVINGPTIPLTTQAQCDRLPVHDSSKSSSIGQTMIRNPSEGTTKSNTKVVRTVHHPSVENSTNYTASVARHVKTQTHSASTSITDSPSVGGSLNSISSVGVHGSVVTAGESDTPPTPCGGRLNQIAVYTSEQSVASISADEDFNKDYKRWIYILEREDILLKEVNELHAEKSSLDVKHHFSSQRIEKYIPILRWDQQETHDDAGRKSCDLDYVNTYF